ncbi:MAG: asparagine synthase-related protein [Gemmatimonadota bacterium]
MNLESSCRVVVHDPRIVESPLSQLIDVGACGWARRPDGTVVLRSDPGGSRPLCWRWLNQAVHLACYPGDLARLEPAIQPEIAILSDLAHFRFPDDGTSPFPGIRRVIAGSETRIATSGIGTESTWWTLPSEPDGPSEIESLWLALVRECRRIINGRRVAILLSGGLDSSAVAAAAGSVAQETGWPLPILASLVYPGLPCDEDRWQESVARHLGLKRVTINPIGTPVWSEAQAVIRRRLAPIIDVQTGAVSRLVRLIRDEGCEVLLTGFGGDVLFRGVGLEQSLIARGRLLAVQRHFRGLSQAMPVSVARLWYGGVVRPIITGARSPGLGKEEIQVAGSSVRSVVARAIRDSAFGWIIEGTEQGGGEPPVTLESPFYGAGFLQAFSRVSQEDFVRRPSHKGILRSMIRPHLPALVVDRQRKTNFLDYHRTWLATERTHMAQRYRALRTTVPLETALPQVIDGALEATGGLTGFTRSWMALSALEVLDSARSK